jgi:hypothetical protein
MMSEDKADISQDINVTNLLVAILKTIKTVDVPSELVLNPAEEDTGLMVSYNESDNTFTIALGEYNGSN